MIIYKKDGSLFEGNHKAIVCPVNTEGVMGKGLALQFKVRFPEESKVYMDHCKDRGMSPGSTIMVNLVQDHPIIIFAATKGLWKFSSTVEWVASNIIGIKGYIRQYGIKDIGICALGCGEGGLVWDQQVKPIFDHLLQDLGDCVATIYTPK